MSSKYLKNVVSDVGTAPISNDTLDDDLFSSVGLYSKEEIEEAKYSKFSRFGRILDPMGRLNGAKEYLFFIKPDLHIVSPSNKQMVLNNQLCDNNYLKELVQQYPDVVRQLQYSAPGSNKTPFANLLSFGVNSNLDLPSSEATTIDTPHNVFDAGYEYLGDTFGSDNMPSFSLEFVDTKELEIYHFFRAYAEYHKERCSGEVTPPSNSYLKYRRLHNVMGIYKFIVDEDYETLLYWAYFWGVFPTSVPREAFSDTNFSDGLTFSISFKSAFIDDMDPGILFEFNKKMAPLIGGKKRIYVPRGITSSSLADMGGVDGSLPSACVVRKTNVEGGRNGRAKYKLDWYK